MAATPYTNWEQLEELMFRRNDERMENDGLQLRSDLKNKIVSDVRDYLVLGHRQTLAGPSWTSLQKLSCKGLFVIMWSKRICRFQGLRCNRLSGC